MERDLFREIGMTKHPIDITDKEVCPRELPDTLFKKVSLTNQVIDVKGNLSYEERLAEFKSELTELKNYYKPFMENHIKTEPLKRVHELKEFSFRYLSKGETFSKRNEDREWEAVTVPDYRGPVDEEGKWKAYYKCNFSIKDAVSKEERVIIYFQCVDYKALIYVNGNYVGGHEGFFAPFEFDITDYLEETNELIIECQNDYTILGIGPVLDGDKIYAATGPGFDDPYTGWHHCPAGAGVFGKVLIEVRPTIYIDDIFVRPNIDNNTVELRLGVMNYNEEVKENYNIDISLLPKNFYGEESGRLREVMHYIGIGKNEYRYIIPMKNPKLWEPDTPYLYGAAANLRKEDGVISNYMGTFGLKKFVSDETTTPKGKFFFNNRPFVLRGANEMGHLQQCVMKGDFDQLIDDILIAKLCNLNYYRITQRPVQEEIYDYFDMLGMMHQCDLPLFGFLRRNQFSEAVRQTEEMEHLIRRHVSSVMVSFINEPMRVRKTEDPNDKFSKRYDAKGHRHLLRDELEAFFAAARKAVYVQNPDRVVKNVEGDYDPPTGEGMPDFHCYTMWYSNHGEPIGRLMKGFLPPVKEGWMIGCGEYGAEGLDNEHIINEMYPKEWLETEEDGHWYPDKIVRAQTFGTHGDWYKEQTSITDWVRESQKHQALATKLMTDAFRRRGDVIHHTAIHLLIDAWPSGWMKTLLCCDRSPKMAYFSYKDSLEPLRVNLYTGRNYVYDGEKALVEAWLLNDTAFHQKLTIHAQLMDLDKKEVIREYMLDSSVDSATSICAGKIPLEFSPVEKKSKFAVIAAIKDEKGEILQSEQLELFVYPAYNKKKEAEVLTIGQKAKEILDNLLGEERSVSSHTSAETGLSTLLSADVTKESLDALTKTVKAGGHGILVLPDEKVGCEVAGIGIETKGPKEVFLGMSDAAEDLYMLYNKDEDYIDFIGRYYINGHNSETKEKLDGKKIIYTYGKREGETGGKTKLPFVVQYQVGEGKLTVISLLLEGRVSVNPNLDELLRNILFSKL